MQIDDIIFFLIIAGSIVTSVIRSINEQNKKKPPQNRPNPQTGLPQQTAQQTRQPAQGDLQKRLEEARRRVQQTMESAKGSEAEVGRPPSTPPPFISGGLEGTSLEGQTRERGTLEGQTVRRGTLESSGGLLQEEDYTLKRQPLKPEQLQRERLEGSLSRSERDVFRPIDAANRNPSEFQQLSTSRPFMSESAHRGKPQLSEAATVTRKRQRAPTDAPKHAKIGGSELLSPEMLTEKEVLRGFLWQQILSEPRSKAKLRTYSPQKPRV
jgi:hypothetical protein